MTSTRGAKKFRLPKRSTRSVRTKTLATGRTSRLQRIRSFASVSSSATWTRLTCHQYSVLISSFRCSRNSSTTRATHSHCGKTSSERRACQSTRSSFAFSTVSKSSNSSLLPSARTCTRGSTTIWPRLNCPAT